MNFLRILTNSNTEQVRNKYLSIYLSMHSIKSLIREAKEINSLINAFAKKNPNINPKDLEQLFTADPTTVQNSRGVFAGKYCVWIGNQYVNGKLKVGDIPELKKALNTYNINKSQITTPINEIGSLSDLITIISNYTDDFKATRQLSKGEQTLEKVYEDADWVVYIPHTYEASRKIGGDTSWCTASSDDRYFNMYTKDGPLYVNIRKSDGKKFQFHFPTRQFMDSEDYPININEINLSKGIIKFYEKTNPIFHLLVKYGQDNIGEFKDGWGTLYMNGKCNFINVHDELLSPNQWFDDVANFENGFALVYLNEKWNYIDTQGKIIFPKLWFDDTRRYGKIAVVMSSYKDNLLDLKTGTLKSPNLWFDEIDSIYSDGMNVYIDDNFYYFNFNNPTILYSEDEDKYISISKFKNNININENKIQVTKSDIKNMVMECVCRIISEKIKKI